MADDESGEDEPNAKEESLDGGAHYVESVYIIWWDI